MIAQRYIYGIALMTLGLFLYPTQSTAATNADRDSMATPPIIQILWGNTKYEVTLEATPSVKKFNTVSGMVFTPSTATVSVDDIVNKLDSASKHARYKILFFQEGDPSKGQVRLLDEKGITGYIGNSFSDATYLELLKSSRADTTTREKVTGNTLLDTSRKYYNVQIVKMANTLTEDIDEIASKSFLDEVGKFTLLSTFVPSFKTTIKSEDYCNGTTYGEEPLTSINIEVVRIRIVDGFIVDIFAETPEHELYVLNFRSSKSLFYFHNNIRHLKLFSNLEPDNFIFLKDIISFTPGKYIGYKPDDDIVTLNEKNTTEVIHQSYTLNSILDVRVYTDLRSLLSNQPNGLLNLEAKSEIPLNTLNSGRWIWAAYLQPNIRFSRFDSEQKLIVNNGATEVTGLNVYQQSKLSAGLDFNLGKSLAHTGRSEFTIDLFGSFNNTDLFDSSGTSLEENYNTLRYGGRMALQTNLNSRFWINISTDLSALNPIGETQITGYDKIATLWGSTIEISYRPREKESDGFYIKYGIVDDLNTHTGDYSFLQFGYRVSITQAYNKAIGNSSAPGT